MCMYNFSLDDELVMQAQQSFANEALMKVWLQKQVEAVLMDFNARQQAKRQNAREAIIAMRRQSEQNGNALLSLDDINSEIQQARAAKKAVR